MALAGPFGVVAKGLTLESWDTETAGKKKVLVYFHGSSCKECDNFKPSWKQVKSHFKTWGPKPEENGVFDVECDGDGKKLCSGLGVSGYPMIKQGKPTDKLSMRAYGGQMTFENVKAFAEARFDRCGPEDLDACDDGRERTVQRAELEAYLKLPLQKLLEKITKTEKETSKNERKVSQGITKWREMTQELQEEREEQKDTKPKKGKEKDFEAKKTKLKNRQKQLDKDHKSLLDQKLEQVMKGERVEVMKEVVETKKNVHVEL